MASHDLGLMIGGCHFSACLSTRWCYHELVIALNDDSIYLEAITLIIDFNHAKKVAAGCAALTSCAFLLWVNQNSVQADAQQPAPVVQQSAGQVTNSVSLQNGGAQAAPNDHGNYAYLDQAQIDDHGCLTVSGWHATSAAQNRPYHYIIALNGTDKTELARQNVTDQEVARPDVAKVHPVYGASQSGFKTSFNLGKRWTNLNQVQIISRYTDDAQGNGNAVDYWFAPITIDRQNHANLDRATVADNHLVVTGWHATNLAVNKSHRFIIVYDRTAGKEVAREAVTDVARPDVAKVFPGVADASQSGFEVKIPLTNIKFNHELQIISRYSGAADGNSNYVDYWFSPITNGDVVNRGNLDAFDISDGQYLVVTGWHATNLSSFEKHRVAILYDDTDRYQVATVPTTTVKRDDVAKAFPTIPGADQSGFVGRFDLSKLHLYPGHRYTIISRYSTGSDSTAEDYSDYTSTTPVALDHQGYNFDSIQMTKDGLKVSGWMISDQSMGWPYAYLIVLNNGQEVGRAAVKLTERPDVAKAYSSTFNSAHSGFSTLIPFDPAAVTGTMQVILRFTGDSSGNSQFTDQYSPRYAANAGNFDQIQVNGNQLYVAGWHASNQAVGKPYEYLIFLNQNGQELYRQRVLDINRTRADVAKVYPATYNSGQSGYQLGFTMPASLRQQAVYVIHRFTDDPAGNGHFADYQSGLVSLGVMRMPIDYRQPSEYAPYPNVRQLNNFWINVRIRQNRVYLMNGNNVVYTMYCSAGYYDHGISTTPTGTYYVQAERGNSFYNGSLGEGANYWTSFLEHGVYLFHTVPTDANGNYKPYEASQLGINQGSHGCIRLSVPDAYWFMHNVPTGTKVVIEN